MKEYVVKYVDADDPGCPVMFWHCKAKNAAHAEMRFEEFDADGWEIVEIVER